MEWKEQFEIFEKIISLRLTENGEKFTQERAAELIGVPLHKYRAWKSGQRPVVEDLRRLAQEFEFKPDWLLLGIGEPVQKRLDKPFDPNFVEICDTLHELVRGLPDRLPKIAEVGGISTTDLFNCIHTQSFPPPPAIAKWIRHYRINANFLLAQIGDPFLTEAEYSRSGPLDFVRERRGDFLTLEDDEPENRLNSLEIVHLQKEIASAQKTIAALEEVVASQKKIIALHEEKAEGRNCAEIDAHTGQHVARLSDGNNN